jgi:hypothetical protein
MLNPAFWKQIGRLCLEAVVAFWLEAKSLARQESICETMLIIHMW